MSSERPSTHADGMTSHFHADDADPDILPSLVPLDCEDLADTFRIDTQGAFRRLIALTPTQHNLQHGHTPPISINGTASILTWTASWQAGNATSNINGVPHRTTSPTNQT